MKNYYIVFAGEFYYPFAGADGIAFQTNDEQEAIDKAKEIIKEGYFTDLRCGSIQNAEWVHVYNCEKRETIFRDSD